MYFIENCYVGTWLCFLNVFDERKQTYQSTVQASQVLGQCTITVVGYCLNKNYIAIHTGFYTKIKQIKWRLKTDKDWEMSSEFFGRPFAGSFTRLIFMTFAFQVLQGKLSASILFLPLPWTRRIDRAVFTWVSKVISVYFGFTKLSDWLKKLAPFYQPIRSKTKTNRDLLAQVFPHFA